VNDPFEKTSTGSHEKTITSVKFIFGTKEGTFNVSTKNIIISAHDQPFCMAM